jgi:hypothetical protein
MDKDNLKKLTKQYIFFIITALSGLTYNLNGIWARKGHFWPNFGHLLELDKILLVFHNFHEL